MRKDLVAIVCCPVHKTTLDVKAATLDAHGDIETGSLHCTSCNFAYPIENGIPNLLPPEYHVDEVRAAQELDSAKLGRKDTKRSAAATPADQTSTSGKTRKA